MGSLNPLQLHGVDSSSPFAKLFVDIFYLTKPQQEMCFKINDDDLESKARNCNASKLEDISDPEDMEDGEIDDLDVPPVKVVEVEHNQEVVEVAPTTSAAFLNVIRKKAKKRGKRNNKFKIGCDRNWEQQKKMKALPKMNHQVPQFLHPQSNGKFVTNLESQFSMDTSPKRLEWLQCFLVFMQDRGTPVTKSPAIPALFGSGAKMPLDLYKLFHLVTAEGGMKACHWQTIAKNLAFPVKKAFILKKIYSQYLLPYEEHMSTANNTFMKVHEVEKKEISLKNGLGEKFEKNKKRKKNRLLSHEERYELNERTSWLPTPESRELNELDERKFLLPTPVATVKKEAYNEFPNPVSVVREKKCVFQRLGSKVEDHDIP